LSEETRRRSFVRLPTEGTTFLRLSKLPIFDLKSLLQQS